MGPQELLPFSFQALGTALCSLHCGQGCPCGPEVAPQSPAQQPADRSTPPGEESSPRLVLPSRFSIPALLTLVYSH